MGKDYKQTVEYLFSRLPMFQRIGAAAYKANLDNTWKLMDALDHPYRQFKSIHIAGTNGKGSTSHMIAAVLQQAGYKTGLYTSPHLKDFRERIRVNGKMIPQNYIVDFVEQHKQGFEAIEPSFFEWTVALAFDYFAKEKVDVAVIETGLGGRLDSTNVVIPELSVITNISMDHMNLLGDTLEKIATEKAGIMKKQVPVLIGERNSVSDEVFIKAAKKNTAPLFFAEDNFKIKAGKQIFKGGQLMLEYTVNSSAQKYTCDLPGYYQAKNIATVCAACSLLNTNGSFHIKREDFHKALTKVTTLTGLKGRWQVLDRKPLVIADTGHNEAGILEVLKNIKRTPHKKLHFVIGMVNDKDVRKVLSMLPKQAVYYFTKASLPRALNEQELCTIAGEFKLKGETYATVKKALKAAKENASKADLIFVGGSTFTVADAI
ncbi:MAG: bifunctional folylpolyglutamate synthase/dihydrofolate synthase [Bacteroidetes bacterium]|jgi:dihydrofolate synthase/folylpolyglutamate synthase|nr:bifunctional folylpolyglutamate synthase/dihydrofolate synthase [Bacteroidota bacterium]